jgi:hypothetical protein
MICKRLKETLMADNRNQNRTAQEPGKQMPEDVLNAAVDPNSVGDPLQTQLEKSKGMNTPEQDRKLEDLKQRNRDKENS